MAKDKKDFIDLIYLISGDDSVALVMRRLAPFHQTAARI